MAPVSIHGEEKYSKLYLEALKGKLPSRRDGGFAQLAKFRAQALTSLRAKSRQCKYAPHVLVGILIGYILSHVTYNHGCNVQFDDLVDTKDVRTVNQDLYDQVRVLCWIMTSSENLFMKALHVRETWGIRCNKILFMSDKTNEEFPAIGLNVSEGRDHLTAKTMRAFQYIYENQIDDADWFLKSDDDTYVIMENLRYFLLRKNPDKPVFYGQHFSGTEVKQGFVSGGAGYVLSREALKRYGRRRAEFCADDTPDGEDVELARCMEKLNVRIGDSRDRYGRSRFHCLQPELHLTGMYRPWYRRRDKYGAEYGLEKISHYAISFHYIPPERMYEFEYFIYYQRAYGIDTCHGEEEREEEDGDHHDIQHRDHPAEKTDQITGTSPSSDT